VYGTWAKSNELDKQPLIDKACKDIAGELGITAVLTGPVWTATAPSVKLYDSDKSHPSKAGTALVALCFVRDLFAVQMDEISTSSLKGVDSKTLSLLKKQCGH
jgi:hypothetical protein